jgi:SAM-dependent methyltransferase
MSAHQASGHQVFDADVEQGGQYVYTTDNRLSCRLANARQSRAVHEAAKFAGLRVLDIGCGDGTYTREFVESAGAAEVLGVDLSSKGVEFATRTFASDRIRFQVAGACELPFTTHQFDIGVLRGVLHHLDDPATAIREALRVCKTVVILEPNGLNPVLKLIERLSPYHRAHKEQSFLPSTLMRWSRAASGRIEHTRFVSLVPFFCPDWMAWLLKRLEPLVELFPIARRFACGSVALRIASDTASK